MVLLILCAPVWSRSSRLRNTRQPARSEKRFASCSAVGRPTRLFFAKRLTEKLGGAKIYLKREDLNHTGAHKINNTIGQCLLARRMGKPRVIAETGAGQHGVATAAAAARFNLACTVYMGSEDARRQHLNVQRMRLLGADVRQVDAGSRTLKDAINEALRDWVTRVRDTHYVLGSVLGPHPFPMMVRDFHRVIGLEARAQFASQAGGLPDVLVAWYRDVLAPNGKGPSIFPFEELSMPISKREISAAMHQAWDVQPAIALGKESKMAVVYAVLAFFREHERE